MSGGAAKRETWPCIAGAHRNHASRTQAAACAEDAERLRRLDEQRGGDVEIGAPDLDDVIDAMKSVAKAAKKAADAEGEAEDDDDA